MQLVQVEGVDAFLSPHHQELVCGLGLGSGVGRLTPPSANPQVSPAHPPLPSTPGDRVDPGDSGVNAQGTAVEDLGEAGTHLRRGRIRGTGREQGVSRGHRAAGKRGYLHAPWGLGGAHGRRISAKEGRSQRI